MNSHYTIQNELITLDDINYICNRKYNYVYIRHKNFKDDLNNLPQCTLHLELNSENYICNHILPFIKWLSIYNCKQIFSIPSSVLILELTTKFIESNPFILNIIPYGVISIIININSDIDDINLNNLPESIETIHIVNSFDKVINVNINVNKYFPNLKWIKCNKYSVNYNDIKKYLISHYDEQWMNKMTMNENNYSDKDSYYYYEMILDDIMTH
jgi:hypothetical protein